jgi:hypothetical protein
MRKVNSCVKGGALEKKESSMNRFVSLQAASSLLTE